MKIKVSQQVKPKVILGIVQCLFTTWCNQKMYILCCNTIVKSPRSGKKNDQHIHLLPGSGVGGKLPPVWPFVDSLPSQGKWYLDWEPKKQQLLSRCLATRDQWTCVKLFRSMKILAHNQNRTFRRNLVLTTFLGKTTRNTKMECRLEMC